MGADDKTKNKVEEITGEAKERIGGATGDDELRARARTTRPRPTSSRPARRSRTPSRTDQHRSVRTLPVPRGPSTRTGPSARRPAGPVDCRRSTLVNDSQAHHDPSPEVATPCSPPAPRDADVIVVGAGPAGSATAYHLAQAGLDVLLLEKTAFPREKVCGDGLTPRAVKPLVAMGIDTRREAGWLHNRACASSAAACGCELPWPDLASYPAYGLVRPRSDFDELLARHGGQGRRDRCTSDVNVHGTGARRAHRPRSSA